MFVLKLANFSCFILKFHNKTRVVRENIFAKYTHVQCVQQLRKTMGKIGDYDLILTTEQHII